MDTIERGRLRDRLLERSENTTDAAGRPITILHDRDALIIARDVCQSRHHVYREALQMGIHPRRYLRNLDVISQEDQLKLCRSRIAVIGAGGIGGNVILLLARMGVGVLVIVDPDIFDESNLNRQALCHTGNLGNPKATEAAVAVTAVNPGVEVIPLQVKLDAFNAEKVLASCDVIVDALDNIPDRLILEGAAKSLGIPMVHGALAGCEGWVMTIYPNDPGLREVYGTRGETGTAHDSPQAILGVPGTTPTLIAALQVMEVVKILLNRENVIRNKLLHVDLERAAFNEFSLSVPLNK